MREEVVSRSTSPRRFAHIACVVPTFSFRLTFIYHSSGFTRVSLPNVRACVTSHMCFDATSGKTRAAKYQQSSNRGGGGGGNRCCSVLRSSIWMRACDRARPWYYASSAAGYTGFGNTPEECTPSAASIPADALTAPYNPSRSPILFPGQLASRPLLDRSNSTRGQIWYQTRHSWYFRKFDAHPMSRGRGMRRRNRTAGRSAVKRREMAGSAVSL